MPNLVRVASKGLEFNVGQAYAEANDLTVLDESAYDHNGQPRPVTAKNGRPRKTKTSVAEAAEQKAAGSKSADHNTTEEN